MSFISGPIPPYSNPPIQPQFYIPNLRDVSGVTLGRTTVVTTVEDVSYVIGQLVRLIIPEKNGCYQLNEQVGYVISIPSSNQIEITIDSSTNVNQFQSSSGKSLPQVVAIGDINSGTLNNSGRTNFITYVPGSYRNIS